MSFKVDRCANPACCTTIDLDWDAVGCACGAVVTCEGCEPADACDVCRDLPPLTPAQDAALDRLARAWVDHWDEQRRERGDGVV